MQRSTIIFTSVVLVLISGTAITLQRARTLGYNDHKAGRSRGGLWNYWPLSDAYRKGAAQASKEIHEAQQVRQQVN